MDLIVLTLIFIFCFSFNEVEQSSLIWQKMTIHTFELDLVLQNVEFMSV